MKRTHIVGIILTVLAIGIIGIYLALPKKEQGQMVVSPVVMPPTSETSSTEETEKNYELRMETPVGILFTEYKTPTTSVLILEKDGVRTVIDDKAELTSMNGDVYMQKTKDPNIFIVHTSDGDVCFAGTNTYVVNVASKTSIQVNEQVPCAPQILEVTVKEKSYTIKPDNARACEVKKGETVTCEPSTVKNSLNGLLINDKKALTISSIPFSCTGEDSGIENLCLSTGYPVVLAEGVSADFSFVYFGIKVGTNTMRYRLNTETGRIEETTDTTFISVPQPLKAMYE